MAPHLKAGERDEMIKWQGKGLTPIQICDRLQKARQRRDVGAPDLTTIRRAIQGKT
jgi:hypothetical protein